MKQIIYYPPSISFLKLCLNDKTGRKLPTRIVRTDALCMYGCKLATDSVLVEMSSFESAYFVNMETIVESNATLVLVVHFLMHSVLNDAFTVHLYSIATAR